MAYDQSGGSDNDTAKRQKEQETQWPNLGRNTKSGSGDMNPQPGLKRSGMAGAAEKHGHPGSGGCGPDDYGQD